jgi:rhodanese-related sulfurtransferase
MYPQSKSKYKGTECGKATRPDLKGNGRAMNRSAFKIITSLLVYNTFILCSFAQIHKDITVNQADSLITANSANPNFTILDVRTSSEYTSGHIGNAINIDYYSPTLRTQLNLLNKNDIHLVYCGSGSRSARATDTMQVLGFIETYNMLGGIEAWKLAGYQVVTNDPPVVGDIPNQEVSEGTSFTAIPLDDYVSDVDDTDSVLNWTVSGEQNITVSVVNRIANITTDDPEWNGSDTLIFTATDPLGASDTDTCIYTVTPINDPPTLNKAIPDTSAEVNKAFSFILDANTFADVDLGDSLVYSASILKEGITPNWITFEPASRKFSGTPADDDKGMLEVIVTATDDSLVSVADTFYIEVKSYVGINNPLDGMKIKLYPNPTNGHLTIQTEGIVLYSVELISLKGQLVYHKNYKGNNNQIDLSSFEKGLYFITIRSGDYVRMQKIIKQ